jgi:hypothetical protein
MFRRGVSKEAIRRLLGHHSWDFTAGTYVHLEDDDLPDGAVVGDLTAPSTECVALVLSAASASRRDALPSAFSYTFNVTTEPRMSNGGSPGGAALSVAGGDPYKMT